MNHEPECNGCDCKPMKYCTHPWCFCDELRAAYQRGRQDAAEATVPVSRKFNGIMTTYADAVYIAARGDGEQK